MFERAGIFGAELTGERIEMNLHDKIMLEISREGYVGPVRFCSHGIEASAISACPKCQEESKAGRATLIVCPHFPSGRRSGECSVCGRYV